MAKIFDTDSRIMCTLSRITNLICLNLLTLICCIPILTVGASAAALFASIRDTIKGRDSKIISRYFNHWIKDFGKATVLFVPVLLVLGVILLDVLYLYRQKTVTFLMQEFLLRLLLHVSECIWGLYRCLWSLTIQYGRRG